MEQKNGLHAFGYNSAESEPIWMKPKQYEPNVEGWGWLWQIFWRDPRSSDSLRNSRNLVSFL